MQPHNPTPLRPAKSRHAGFTLVEMVITILISSIIAVGIITYVGDSVTGFVSAGDRNKLASSGRTVVDRLALELHNALPNSIRVTATAVNGDQCIEFVPFIGATNYVNPIFTGSGSDEFEVINFNPSLIAGPNAGLYAVIYPIATDVFYSAPVSAVGPRAEIDEISDPDAADGVVTVTLNGTHRFLRRSPVDRIYVTEQPVSFCIVGGYMFRYRNYGFEQNQPAVASLPTQAPGRMLISDRMDNTGLIGFVVQEANLRRNAIVSMQFNFVENPDVVQLNYEVQIRNVP